MIMFRKAVAVLVSALMIYSFSSCSKKSDEDAKKSSAKAFTEKVADDALKTIQEPIRQAREVDSLMSERKAAVEDQLEK